MRRPLVAAAAAAVMLLVLPAPFAGPRRALATDGVAREAGTLLGAQVMASEPGDVGWRRATEAVERRLGRGLDLSWHALPWDRGLPQRRMDADLAAGRVPVIAWSGADAQALLDGGDDELAERAARVAALRKPVLIALLPPADDLTEGAGSDRSGDYVMAFRLLRERFAAAGAVSASFVWCPTVEAFAAGSVERWYPGDDAVDWVCAADALEAPAARLSQRFTPFLDWAAEVDRPSILAVAPSGGSGRAAWIEQLQRVVEQRWARGQRIGAVVWTVEEPGDEELAALRRMARDDRLAPPERARGPFSPPRGALLGAHSKSDPDYTPQAAQRATAELEAAIDRRLDVAHAFYPWGKPFPTAFERWSLSEGRIPMISWNGTDTRAIVAGHHDALIRERADAVAALNEPVLLRWFWEMDGRRKAGWARSPGEFIAAWRHIRAIFRERGADQVAWVWCPNAFAFANGDASRWYPGDDAVDWVCADGYNMAGAQDGAPFLTFYEVFRDFYVWADERGKPIMVGETGVLEGVAGGKAAWIRQSAEDLKTWFPNIQAYVYFDAEVYEDGWDWRLESSPSSLRAFAAIAADPYLNPRRERLQPTCGPAP